MIVARSGAAFAALLALTACTSLPRAGAPLTGSWGGAHIGLTLSEAGGTVDYDCAAGRIDGPIVPRADGSFNVAGSHTPATGGPERLGEVRPSHPAIYWGRVAGETMTLVVAIETPEGSPRLGPFALVRRAEPRIFRCL